MINSYITEKIKNANLVPEVHILDGVEVEIYNICYLVEAVDPTYALPYHTVTKVMEEWCELNDAIYYAAPRESFSYYAAMKEAISKNKKKVIVEDLS